MGQLPPLQVEKIHPLQAYISLLSQLVDLYGISRWLVKSGTKFFVSFPSQEGQSIKFWFKHSRKTVFLRSQMGQPPLLQVKKIHLVSMFSTSHSWWDSLAVGLTNLWKEEKTHKIRYISSYKWLNLNSIPKEISHIENKDNTWFSSSDCHRQWCNVDEMVDKV